MVHPFPAQVTPVPALDSIGVPAAVRHFDGSWPLLTLSLRRSFYAKLFPSEALCRSPESHVAKRHSAGKSPFSQLWLHFRIHGHVDASP